MGKNIKQWLRHFLELKDQPQTEVNTEELVPVDMDMSDIKIAENTKELRCTEKEICQEMASKYKTSSDFKKHNPHMYKKSVLLGCIQEFYPEEIKKIRKSTRTQLLDYAENCGHPVTKQELRSKMLDISNQPQTRYNYGSSYLDNVSKGTSVFIPAAKDKRYLKAVEGSGKNTLYKVETI